MSTALLSFAVCGILTPIEILVFIAISAYTSFIAEQEARAKGPPKNDESSKKDDTKVDEVERPLIVQDNINDLD